MKKIRIALADDQDLFRQGLEALLSDYEDFKVVFTASNGKELLDKLPDHRIDIVLVDLEMPVMNGLEATKKIKVKFPEVKVLPITMHDEEDFVVHLIESGASGYLVKNVDVEYLADAIYSVHDTGYYFNDMVSKAMVKGLVKSKRVTPTFGQITLTDREIEVLQLICNEYTNKEIAEKLCVSVRTVDGHRERIMQKTGVRNTAGMVMYAVKNDLVGP